MAIRNEAITSEIWSFCVVSAVEFSDVSDVGYIVLLYQSFMASSMQSLQ